MKKLPLALLIGAAFITHSALATEQNRTISYLTSWGLHSDDAETLAQSKVDTFLLSFGKWDSEGNITTSDDIATIPRYDAWWMPVAYSTWTQVKLAHPEKKMMVAFGGQTYEDIWSHLNTDSGREKIAQALVKLLNTGFPVYKKNLTPQQMVGECLATKWDGSCDMGLYQKAGTVYLDGVDFDFEKAARLTTEENDNLLKLSQRVRQLLGPESKKLLSLTTYHVGADPVACADSSVQQDCSYIEDKRSSHHGEVLPLLAKSKDVYDFFNVMAYDAGRNFKYKVAMNNYARAVGDAGKIVLGATINKQWGPNGNFLESRQNNIARAEWQAANNYGGFFVWTLGASTEQMRVEDQVDYINEMKQAADGVTTPEPVEDTIPPSAPANLTASVQGKTIALSWQPATDNLGVSAYWVYRNSVKMDVVTATSWSDKTAQPAVEYSYHVMAVDAAGNISQASNRVEAKIPQEQEIIAPNVPEDLRVDAASKTTLAISWKPVSNVTVSQYHVYRDGKLLQKTTAPAYQDQGLTPATRYQYSVVAQAASGALSAHSATLQANTASDEMTGDAWKVGVQYKVGDVVTYQGKKYSCRQPHMAMAHWNPADVLALWLPVN
ncbi:glycosyl hydrolase family 18 protein [Pantoea sp. B65]|uniref:glycosyl hydrolase family 18 protein n=1 Tax=Pantoea sp. B65 TaxID=2813359 RepID=UPI0039B582C2